MFGQEEFELSLIHRQGGSTLGAGVAEAMERLGGLLSSGWTLAVGRALELRGSSNRTMHVQAVLVQTTRWR